ncbi:uncharacterized protein KY384_004325 [Bacidia gigantensis]|uniref:uncharacterized protein n=1 Tax=Bacidia gigantensis TaxID=2732470 RepID=UPI001D050DED|nr:uncharacterized protein KY384_004325 [Bacidia gigantensis]KAG8530968.1 hypothetical protein KY384_004325 [Bacidia gigantensis]
MHAPSADYDLYIRQEPERAKTIADTVPDRKTIDPPPAIQLQHIDPSDPSHLIDQDLGKHGKVSAGCEDPNAPPQPALLGMLVSSLHRLKDTNNLDAGFFVFGDLSVKLEGKFRLRFSLFEIKNGQAEYIKSVNSAVFEAKKAARDHYLAKKDLHFKVQQNRVARLPRVFEIRILGTPIGPQNDTSNSRDDRIVQKADSKFLRYTHSGSTSSDLYANQFRQTIPPSYQSSSYPQATQQHPMFAHQLSFGQERMEPSTSIQSEVADSPSWLGLSAQQQQQYGRPPSFMQYEPTHPPVPPERQLPSSTPAIFSFGGGHQRVLEQGSYGSEPGQPQYWDEQRHVVGRRSSYGTQDNYPQLPSRTLPAPSQPVGSASNPGSHTAGGPPVTSAGFERGMGAYQNSSYYPGQPPFR